MYSSTPAADHRTALSSLSPPPLSASSPTFASTSSHCAIHIQALTPPRTLRAFVVGVLAEMVDVRTDCQWTEVDRLAVVRDFSRNARGS